MDIRKEGMKKERKEDVKERSMKACMDMKKERKKEIKGGRMQIQIKRERKKRLHVKKNERNPGKKKWKLF